MSSRIARVLLKLYPRPVRDRYGRELLTLQADLRARGELSRGRLVWDMLAGSLEFRRARLAVAGGLVVAAAIAGVTAVAVAGQAAGPRRGAATLPVRIAARVPAHPALVRDLPIEPTTSGSCFVGSGSCSISACTVYTARRPDPARRRGVGATRCAARPDVPPPRPVFVSG